MFQGDLNYHLWKNRVLMDSEVPYYEQKKCVCKKHLLYSRS